MHLKRLVLVLIDPEEAALARVELLRLVVAYEFFFALCRRLVSKGTHVDA